MTSNKKKKIFEIENYKIRLFSANIGKAVAGASLGSQSRKYKLTYK